MGHLALRKSSPTLLEDCSVKHHPLNNGLLSFPQQLVLGYVATQPSGHPKPTLKPVPTQKERDELELGVLKEFLWWLVPVQAEFHRETMA